MRSSRPGSKVKGPTALLIVILIVINSHVSIALASKSHSCSWANLLPNPEQLLQSRGSHARFHGNLIKPVSSKCVFTASMFPFKKV